MSHTPEDERDTDRPPPKAPARPRYSIIGWRAGQHLPLLLSEGFPLSSLHLHWDMTELQILVGKFTSVSTLLGPLAIADHSALAAWNRLQAVIHKFERTSLQMGYAYILPSDAPTPIGVGIAIETDMRWKQRAQFCVAIHMEEARVGYRLTFKREVRDLATIDRIGCEWTVRALKAFPRILSKDSLPSEVASLQVKECYPLPWEPS